MRLYGKRILLGVTGSIAAYKSAVLTRLLVKEGAEVQILMSASALDFITPLTLSTLSKNPVLHSFKNESTEVWTNHVELGLWADLFLVAPISANTLAKFANGICDNLLSATYLSCRCPVMVAPAMDLDMYQHPSVKSNLQKVLAFGNLVLEAEKGELASGLNGQGRLMEPEHIVEQICLHFQHEKSFSGKKILVTSGPTKEAIDPVRYITNHSTGKMGGSIALAFAQKGGEVHLIIGEGAWTPNHPNIHTYPIKTAQEMFHQSVTLHHQMDICVFAAAVADYSPKNVSAEKIKKNDETLSLELVKNVDIAKKLGDQKLQNQIHIGFALETEDGSKNAKLKLSEKNLDMIVLNTLQDEGAGFKHDTNKITMIFQDGREKSTSVLPKYEIAELILEGIKSIPVQI